MPKICWIWLKFWFQLSKDPVLELSGKQSSCSERISWEAMSTCLRIHYYRPRLIHQIPSTIIFSKMLCFARATGPFLTSVKEENHVILPTTLNFAVRRGKLWIYTIQNPSEVFWKFSPPEGYKECAVVCFAKMERSSSFIHNMWTK